MSAYMVRRRMQRTGMGQARRSTFFRIAIIVGAAILAVLLGG
ncbi:MAG: hypothetical protein WEE89_05470 [Gemmatimonadota bacterium]